MSTKTVTIGKDGTLVITKSDEGASGSSETTTPIVIHPGHHRSGFDASSFIAGLIVGMVLLLLVQRRKRVKAQRAALADADGDGRRADSDYAALARRTATLERIVTDPAQRVGAEIDALR